MSEPAVKLSAAFVFEPEDWIGLAEAARLMGANRDALGRRCRDELAGQNLAIFHRLPGQRNKGWLVSRSLDHRLRDGAAAATAATGEAPDLEQYTDAQRAVAWARWRALTIYRAQRRRASNAAGWQRAAMARIEAEVIEPLRRQDGKRLRVSERSLRRWDALAPTIGEVEALVDKRGGDVRQGGDAEAWAYFERIFLDPRRPSKKNCWRRTREHAAEAGLAWPSYESVVRHLDAKIPPEKQLRHRDPDLWRSKMAPYVEQDAERYAAGECWVGDHRPMDLMCRIATPKGEVVFRPWLTLWQDWRTRKIVGWVLSDAPNSSTILQAFREAMLDPSNGGGPSLVIVDNGRDFDSYTFHGRTKQQRRQQGRVEFSESQYHGILSLLGIEPHFSLAFNPQGKARCERVFATIGDHFDKSFPTYTGKDVNHKPELLKKTLDAARNVPTFSQVRERFAEWVRGFNLRVEHEIDDLFDEERGRLSPAGAMELWRTHRRVYADPEVLELCLQQIHKPVSFGRAGIKLTIAGRRVTFGRDLPELSRFKGRGAVLNCTYDPHDLRAIRVYDDQWRFVCYAPIDASGGVHGQVDQAHVRELQRRKAAYNRSLKTVQGSFDLQYRSDEELLAEMAEEDAACQGEQAAAADVPLKIVRTPLDGNPPPAPRKAAGSESDAMPSGGGLPSLDRLRQAYRRDQTDEDPLADIDAGGGWMDVTRLRKRADANQ